MITLFQLQIFQAFCLISGMVLFFPAVTAAKDENSPWWSWRCMFVGSTFIIMSNIIGLYIVETHIIFPIIGLVSFCFFFLVSIFMMYDKKKLENYDYDNTQL